MLFLCFFFLPFVGVFSTPPRVFKLYTAKPCNDLPCQVFEENTANAVRKIFRRTKPELDTGKGEWNTFAVEREEISRWDKRTKEKNERNYSSDIKNL